MSNQNQNLPTQVSTSIASCLWPAFYCLFVQVLGSRRRLSIIIPLSGGLLCLVINFDVKVKNYIKLLLTFKRMIESNGLTIFYLGLSLKFLVLLWTIYKFLTLKRILIQKIFLRRCYLGVKYGPHC